MTTYQSPSEAPRFKWKCSYQGTVWYEVRDSSGMYGLELRRRADDYERKRYNGDDADWQRNVVDMIGVLRREYDSQREVPAATLHAFNAWIIGEHGAHMAKLRADPQRYGTDFSAIVPPTLARAAARYQVGTGWIITAQSGSDWSFVPENQHRCN